MADQEAKKVDQNETKDTKDHETKTEVSDAKDDAKQTTKANDKSPTKPKTPVKETKAKKETKKKEEEPEESDDDEELVGILDAPLVVEGKRVRKSTEFLSSQVLTPQSVDRKKIEKPEGKGDTLGSMPRVVFQLNKIPADELKPLHKVLYGRQGNNTEVKKNIRAFNGFNIEKDSKEYKKKEEQVDRFTMDSLRRLCEILDVKKGKKEEMLESIMDFLLLPKASGMPVEAPKKRSASKKSNTKRKRPEKKEKKSSSKKTKSDETAVKSDEDGEGEDEDEKAPPAKKIKSSEKSPEKSPVKSSEKSQKKAKKESKKPTKKEKKVVSIKISPGNKAKKSKPKAEKKKAESDSSDEEPLSKKAKKSPPTNNEIVELVKELLEGADLEKITMKSVCKQVYDRFPDFDLTDRKEFIKDAVKEIIT